jgi:hypothetical protein
MILYANSCSIGVCSTGKTYADFLGEHLHATVINAGKSGVCNSRIFRTSIRDLLELQKQDEEITAVISLGATYRSELWRPEIPVINNDGHFNSFQITSLDKDDKFNPSDQIKFFKEWFKWYNDEAEITNVCTQLIMFVAFLEKNNINYLIWVGGRCYKEIDTTAPFLNILYDQIKNNPKIFNIFNFSFGKFATSRGYIPYDYEEFGVYGHHTEEAHRDFANYLITKL